MKTLVIPDIHLKPWIFDLANETAEECNPDRIVCLMDIPDSHELRQEAKLYEASFDAAINFAKRHPETLWCYGNHELGYLWGRKDASGYYPPAEDIVKNKLKELQSSLPDPGNLAYVHRLENTIFCHGGLCDEFVRELVPEEAYDDVDRVIRLINECGEKEIWVENSPIWFRPQLEMDKPLYKADEIMQVVGHTPMQRIVRVKNLISCDVFFKYPQESVVPPGCFLIINTEGWEAVAV